MNHWFSLLNIAGSAGLAAFGLYVWRVEPDNRRNQAFALFAVGFSLGTALSNVQSILSSPATIPAGDALRGVLYGLGGIGAAGFGVATVEPDRRTALKWLVVPGVLAVVGIAAEMDGFLFYESFAVAVVLNVGFSAGLVGGSMFTALLLAEDFRRPDLSRERRREWAFLAAALILYPAFYLTLTASRAVVRLLDPSPGFPLGIAFYALALLVTLLLVVGEWIRNTQIPEASAAARNVALLTAGMGIVGLGLAVPDVVPEGDLGVPFLARTGAVLILGYGVLRHQLLGIDEKVRFGLSKTTVAGIFVAVFFIVSEAAQVLFADVAGNNELIGVIAAGLLVFAISPLQRFADRFAAKAVPGGGSATVAGGADPEEAYRRALRVALRDREITEEEERDLLVAADEMGIGTERAFELRDEVRDALEGEDPEGGAAP